MKGRCAGNDPRRKRYYSDRGIDLCEKWESFEGFLADMGDRPPGTSLDRIDNNKGYYKENCRWVTHKTQCRNRRTNKFIEWRGQTKTLAETTHYNVINNNIIEFIQGYNGSDPIKIWGLFYNNDAQNPARIIDRETATQISPIQYWDPARGIHYSNAIHNVDLQNVNDPAQYNTTSRTVTYSGIWKESFVGTTWLNTENLDYIPYYSKEAFVDTTERFRNWGQLADWSSIELYEWVESDVPPSEWDALAAIEEGDRTIIEHLRKSGTARKILLEYVGNVWVPAVNKFDEQYAVITGIDNGNGTFTFTVDTTNFTQTGSPLQYSVNVYVNGKLFVENYILNEIGGSPITSHSAIVTSKEADVIRFVQLVPTTQTDIDALILEYPEKYKQEYEYVRVSFYDELATIFYKYYFWVNGKGTKPTGKNRTMPIAEAQNQLANIPAAHMFFQEAKIPEEVITEDIIVTRSEITVPEGSPLTQDINIELPVVENTTILVEVNGVDLLDSEFVYVSGGSPNVVTIVPTLIEDDVVRITYSGVVNKPIELPHRFTQAVVRGLQGIVNADNRYTIRYTRNFTLRDTLNAENVDSMDSKNFHEEWKIFRQEQQFNIDRWQWDKITESIIGYLLTNPTIRVPSYERELYDEKYNTDTQYGLGSGQSFVNGTLALSSIIAYLVDPNIDFVPVDIDTFFSLNSFDTAENITVAMNEIYNTFSFTHVNRMYFSVLKDAFTTKTKYPDIFKTSMISLHGIKPFQTSGVFDD